MTTYARWPDSVWYVYDDVNGTLHVMSIDHTDDEPLRIQRDEVCVVTADFLRTMFPGTSDTNIEALLEHVGKFGKTAAVVTEVDADIEPDDAPEVDAPVPAPTSKKRRKRALETPQDPVAVVPEQPPPVEPEQPTAVPTEATSNELMPDW